MSDHELVLKEVDALETQLRSLEEARGEIVRRVEAPVATELEALTREVEKLKDAVTLARSEVQAYELKILAFQKAKSAAAWAHGFGAFSFLLCVSLVGVGVLRHDYVLAVMPSLVAAGSYALARFAWRRRG